LTKDPYNYKLSGVGDPHYHLGGGFSRDDCGTLTWGQEIDQSEELGGDGVSLHQSLIIALQWAVNLGRFDILVAVMSMSCFRINSRVRHLERLKRVLDTRGNYLLLESVLGLVFTRMKITLKSQNMIGCIVSLIALRRLMISCLYLEVRKFDSRCFKVPICCIARSPENLIPVSCIY
jgi:hypothetical protein